MKRPPLNVRDRNQREALCERQNWLCYWCGGRIRVVRLVGRESMPPDGATLCSLDTRLTFERGLHAGEFRKVASCHACTTKRAQMIEATVPIEELRDRAQGSRA